MRCEMYLYAKVMAKLDIPASLEIAPHDWSKHDLLQLLNGEHGEVFFSWCTYHQKDEINIDTCMQKRGRREGRRQGESERGR
jgi:hypothetical protein